MQSFAILSRPPSPPHAEQSSVSHSDHAKDVTSDTSRRDPVWDETTSLLASAAPRSYSLRAPSDRQKKRQSITKKVHFPVPSIEGQQQQAVTFPFTKPYTIIERGFNTVPLTQEGVTQLQLDIVNSSGDWPMAGFLLGMFLGPPVAVGIEMGFTASMGGDPFHDSRWAYGFLVGLLTGPALGCFLGTRMTSLQPRDASKLNPLGFYHTGIVGSEAQSMRISYILEHPNNSASPLGPNLPRFLIMSEPGSVTQVLSSRNQRLNLSLTPSQIHGIEVYYRWYCKIAYKYQTRQLQQA